MLSGDNSNTDQASISQLTIQESWRADPTNQTLSLLYPEMRADYSLRDLSLSRELSLKTSCVTERS